MWQKQLGIIKLRDTPSLNKPRATLDETLAMQNATKAMGELFNADRFTEALAVSDAALGAMRAYPCWEAATMLQNTGLTLLRLLVFDTRRTDAAWALRTLHEAEEAFASSMRYAEGTWMERTRREQVGGWISWAKNHRQQEGLPPLRSDEARSMGTRGAWLWGGARLMIAEPPHPTHPDEAGTVADTMAAGGGKADTVAAGGGKADTMAAGGAKEELRRYRRY